MHAVRRHALRLLPQFSSPSPCRVIGGRRFPIPSRSFHRSAIAYRIPGNDGSNKTNSTLTQEQDDEVPVYPGGSASGSAAEVVDTGSSLLPEQAQRSKEQQSNYGSAARRSARNKKPREIPPVELPRWFLEGSVTLAEESKGMQEELLRLYVDTPTIRHVARNPEAEAESTDPEKIASAEGEDEPARYNLHEDIWKEIFATIRAGLSLPKPSFADGFPAAKSHVLLQCPKDGGVFFLDAIVEKAAAELGADLVRIDAQDLAEIGGDYIGEGPDPSPYSIRSLAYDAQQVVARQSAREIEDEEPEEEEFELEEDDDQPPSRGPPTPFGLPNMSKISAIPILSLSGNLADLLKSGKLFSGNNPPNGLRMPLNNASSTFARSVRPSSEQWNDMKLSILLESFLDASLDKKRLSKTNAKTDTSTTTEGQEDLAMASDDVKGANSTIIMIRDYKEVNSTAQGGRILSRLHEILRKRRKEGQSIVLVGTVSSADLMPSVSKNGIRNMQSEYEDGLSRTIIVTAAHTPAQQSVFREDETRRIRDINMRHLRDILRRRGQDEGHTLGTAGQTDWRLDSSLEFASGIGESVWPFDRVHRVAVSTLGAKPGNEPLTPEDVGTALQVLDASDEVKFRWANDVKQSQKFIGDTGRLKAAPAPTSPLHDVEEKMKKLRKNCNAHEKKLFGGVINPENIHTTFNDVRAPPETIEALKTLTSLSLIRPEAFSYGVLATDKIPGLLLYGPPGTGKTLLAKAVAKESGATVLEVSGAEVYDMYVGEGEKNVKAIFSLAKKLSPCVVFIDEADAIFGSRSSHANRTSHRELINMFLQQWDGMNDLSAFIMVATNRPFDLDDAVLRRLPRRLLVDLPTEKDREEILKIHLKDEMLDPDVSLAELAKQTNLYSGSDLKNISVAAALSCVREEIELAAKQADYKPPDKRTLAKRHFEKALDEISASISEDMGSLSAIKKFDEKYGDRRGKKAKVTNWGFGEKGGKVETGRVRN